MSNTDPTTNVKAEQKILPYDECKSMIRDDTTLWFFKIMKWIQSHNKRHREHKYMQNHINIFAVKDLSHERIGQFSRNRKILIQHNILLFINYKICERWLTISEVDKKYFNWFFFFWNVCVTSKNIYISVYNK